MKLISSPEALNFLSQAAPRPWVQRLLRWMAFDGELDCYSSRGIVQAHTDAFMLTSELIPVAGEAAGRKMDAAIREHFSPELAAKLISKDRFDRIDDEAFVWDGTEDPKHIDPGFFLYATEIDWDEGVLKAEIPHISGDLEQAIFPTDEFFGSEFDKPEFKAELRELSFFFDQIELLLPNVELRRASGFVAELPERRRAGRPPKWDWEGAMAFVVSQAQLPDGLPTGAGAQTRIEEMIAGWFTSEAGDSPAPSEIRQRAAKIMRMLEMSKKPKSA